MGAARDGFSDFTHAAVRMANSIHESGGRVRMRENGKTSESGRWEDRLECQEATAEAEGSLGRSKCGVLMRRNNAEAVLQMPTNADQGADWFIHEVNRAWAGLFLQDEWLEQPETVELVKSLSTTAPLLFFFDADEYGWGYRLSAGGEERAAKAFEVHRRPNHPNGQ